MIVAYMTKNILKLSLLTAAVLTLTSCESSKTIMSSSNETSTTSVPVAQNKAINTAFWQGNPTTVWNKVQQLPLKKLEANHSTDPTISGWTKLAIISKRNSGNTKQLIQSLTLWRTEYPNHPGNSLIPNDSTLAQLSNDQAPHHIALLLPLQGAVGQQGKMVRDGFLKAYYANRSKTNNNQTVAFYDTSSTANIADIYQKAVSEGADFIVGPLTKDHVQALAKQASFSTPILALNYTESGNGSPNLYEFGLSPMDEAQQLADKAKEKGHAHALIITTQNDWGQRVSKALQTRWQANGGSVQDVLYISPQTNLTQAIATLLHVPAQDDKTKKLEDHDKALLEQRRRQDFDVVFVLTPPQTARQVVPLLRFYYVNKTPIYSTSIVYSGTPSPQKDADINGVIFADIPWVLKNHGKNSNRLYAVGMDAYALSNEMPRLNHLSNFPIYGATGAMTLNSQHQIYRRLPWTTMRNGQP